MASDRSRFDSNVGEPGGEKEDALFRRVSSVFDCIDSGVSSKEDGEDEMLLFGIFWSDWKDPRGETAVILVEVRIRGGSGGATTE